ncbi:MAG: DUF3581 domain-containing protein [gamma proteobacterium symbiont of Bathyaustriella thionipta]|nr:DUF3581 domain-containing protein [gamma proteobacterium symbiont of Bathyaustriella thionipta]MCU7949403.1 DUF3581 domain-containing protein [gamma proteobacterium symbiont of Bathyaustriella thionipta]MCU7953608.1 DUF3581 domain-containing protein [gamma proteobacterium symbiont of Bathyaustriella thionipta]MCU7956257.1 DUF3581 domain-containing protein [gamma proteobacterium symbiont of Bathyaustriella thionipta]MCU7965987.1 DUF3581 domain-containing protein [gamma proteobacterium symbion
MNIANYFNYNDEYISFTRSQASLFAKGVAGDFNPIHDEDAKRFCVPGDLLFSVFLAQYGISQKMKFEFSGMVVDTSHLIFPEEISDTFILQDDNEKNYMDVVVSGEKSQNSDFIATLSEKYVQFSSKTFPHILVPLMEQENVMINPSRPLVIYKNMEICLDKLSGNNIELKLTNTSLKNSGKKGEVRLEFAIMADGEEIGHGAKNLLLSGLREYDAEQLDGVIHTYTQRKSDFIAQQ